MTPPATPTLDDFTPDELRKLASLLMDANGVELRRVQSVHTGGPLPLSAQDHYNRQHALITGLNVEADRRENPDPSYSVILDQAAEVELTTLSRRAPVTVTRLDDGKVELTSTQPIRFRKDAQR